MADSEKSGNEIIHLSEETQSGLDDENHIRSQDSQPPPSAENQCVPHGYKFQDENRLVPKESQSGLQPYQQQPPMPFPVNLIEGNYNKPNFGPVRNTKYVEANKIENATVVHHHYNYYPEQRSSHGAAIDSSKNRTTETKKQKSEVKDEDCVKIFEDTFMYIKQPIRPGANVYKGYQAHVTGQKQSLAIKRITPCDERSIREVKHLVRLCEKSPHPNVMRIIRSKVHEGLTQEELYIVMEVCREENLQDYLDGKRQRNEPVDLNQAMLFADQLISAIRHIHHYDIIHGDLKPENILFSLDGQQIKVSDFGISKQLMDFRSRTKLTGKGTDGYRAPETYTSEVISKSADIYSLAINLYSLFTNGDHPFGSDPDLWIYRIKKNVDLDLSGLPMEMGKGLKVHFTDLLQQIFQLEPEKRPTIEGVVRHPFTKSLSAQTKEVPFPGADFSTVFVDTEPSPGSKANPPAAFADKKSFAGSDTIPSTAFHGTKAFPGSDTSSMTVSTGKNSFQGSDANPPMAFTGKKSSPGPDTNSPEPSRLGIHPKSPQMSDDNPLAPSTHPKLLQASEGVKNHSLDLDDLEWHVTGPNCHEDIIIEKIEQGCRICCDPPQTFIKSDLLQPKVRINGCEIANTDLRTIPVPMPWSLQLWPGIVVCPDKDKSRLFAVNQCHKSLKLNFYDECEPEAQFSVLPAGESIPIFSAKKLSKYIEVKRGKNEPLNNLPGVIFSISLSISKHEVFRITPHYAS